MRYSMLKSSKKLISLLAVAALTIALSPFMAGAQDCIIDGIPDDDCDGFNNNIDGTCIPIFADGPCYLLNATKQDVFIAINSLASSYIPSNALDLLADPNQFDFNVIQVTANEFERDENGFSRRVYTYASNYQNGLVVQESARTDITEWGYCSAWTFNNLFEKCTIYTHRISERIEEVCGPGWITNPNCTGRVINADGSDYPVTGADLLAEAVTWAVLHEIGHATTNGKWNKKIGFHYAVAANASIMAQAPYWTEKKGKVTWYFPHFYSNEVKQRADTWADVHE